MKEEIIKFIGQNSYFSFDQEEELDDGKTLLIFSTRENGDMVNEEYGLKDYMAAKELRENLSTKFSGVIEYEFYIEPVDEWVMIEIIV